MPASRFSSRPIAQSAVRAQDFLARGVDVYLYFNNDPEGWALRNADRLRAMLAQAIVEQG